MKLTEKQTSILNILKEEFKGSAFAEDVVKKTEDGKYYKVKETEDEIKMDLLANMAADIKAIKCLFTFSLCAEIIFIVILYALMSSSH